MHMAHLGMARSNAPSPFPGAVYHHRAPLGSLVGRSKYACRIGNEVEETRKLEVGKGREGKGREGAVAHTTARKSGETI